MACHCCKKSYAVQLEYDRQHDTAVTPPQLTAQAKKDLLQAWQELPYIPAAHAPQG